MKKKRQLCLSIELYVENKLFFHFLNMPVFRAFKLFLIDIFFKV